MAKVNFTKVEGAFDHALRKLFIDNLSDLASIANVLQDPQANLSNKNLKEVILRFQNELKKLKMQDSKLFQKLNLSQEEEARLHASADDFNAEDLLRIKALKERIEALKKELQGSETSNPEDDKQIAEERRKHINKRFNTKDGWLPLH